MKSFFSLIILFISVSLYAQTYTEIERVIASDRAEFARFGQAVAITDNYAVVGAYGAGTYNNGQVYIFEKQGNNWVQTQILQNSDNENYDRFGYSVAIDGDWLIVGAIGEDDDENGNNNISKAGSVYIYKNISGTWTQTQKIVANDRSADDEFGWSLDIDGTTMIIGAHQDFEDENGLNPIHHAGSCYLFDLNMGTGVWTQTQKIVASDRAPDLYYPNGYTGEDLSDQFGHSVAISGDYIVVGALNHDYRPDLSSGWQCGSAYIFERSSGTWIQVQQIINSDNAAGIWERFGSDVAIDSNIIVVGVWSQDYTPTGTDYMKNAGAAYVFVRNASGVWIENQKLVAGMRNSGDHFGWDVKINDGFIISGTEHDDHDENESNPLHEAGSAYIFQIDGSGMFNQIQKIVGSDRDSLDIFGYAVDTYGANIIAGAFQHDWNLAHADSMQEAGKAYIFSSITCPPVSTTQNVTICNGQSYTVGSSSYTTTGTYTDILTTVDGCDSIITTQLNVATDFSITNTVSICSGQSYSVGASTYSVSGSYQDTLQSSMAGCDSIITTNLTVYQPFYINENINICNGQSYTVGSSTYTISGTYTDSLTTINGCDSVIVTNLNVSPSNYNQSFTICDGESVMVGTNIYTTAGTYVDSLISSLGCDSILTSSITISNGFEISQNIVLCYGESYSIGNSTYSIPGNYTDTLQMATSLCDSIVHTNLTVNPPIDNSITVLGNEMTSNQDNAVYQWVDCNANNQPLTNTSANLQTLNFNQDGTYAVIINKNGCVDTSSCVAVAYVNLLKQDLVSDIKLFPNPTQQYLMIQTNGFTTYDIDIFDMAGKLINHTSTSQKLTKINVDALRNGVYIIKIISNESTITKQFIKQ
jgi:hypothetical protein